MPKNNTFVGARLSEEMKEAFDKHLSESGKTSTQVVREAIRRYLNFRESKITVDIDWKTGLEDRVTALEEIISQKLQKTVQLDLGNADNSVVIKDDNNAQLLTSKELSELPGCSLKYRSIRDRHCKGQIIEFPNGVTYEPIREDGRKPRWKPS